MRVTDPLVVFVAPPDDYSFSGSTEKSLSEEYREAFLIQQWDDAGCTCRQISSSMAM